MKKSRVREYVDSHTKQLQLLNAMWKDPRVQCYNDEKKPPRNVELALGSVFLGGPTSRNQLISCNWRCRARAFLRSEGYRGFIYVPEPRGLELAEDFTERSYIHQWESSRLLHAVMRAFWIPRRADELLGLNTNLEFGIFIGLVMSGSVKATSKTFFVGWPPEAERMGLPHHYACELAGIHRFLTLNNLCRAIIDAHKNFHGYR